jgi:hypothetical protein
LRAKEGTRTPDLPLTRRQALWEHSGVLNGRSSWSPVPQSLPQSPRKREGCELPAQLGNPGRSRSSSVEERGGAFVSGQPVRWQSAPNATVLVAESTGSRLSTTNQGAAFGLPAGARLSSLLRRRGVRWANAWPCRELSTKTLDAERPVDDANLKPDDAHIPVVLDILDENTSIA